MLQLHKENIKFFYFIKIVCFIEGNDGSKVSILSIGIFNVQVRVS